MHELNVIDESFDIKHSFEYHISIQVGLDGFSFCILDLHKNKYIALRHIPLIVGKLQFLVRKIETIFEQEEILNITFKSISITYSTNKATLIPKEFSVQSFDYKLATFTDSFGRSEEILTNKLPGFDYQLIYSCPKDLITLFNSRYTDFNFRHKTTSLLSLAVNQMPEKQKTLIINFEKKYIRMIALKGNEILLYNSFYYRNESDFLYYTLNICHSLNIDAEQDKIRIGGYVGSDSAYIRQLKKYFSNVHFILPLKEFKYGKIFDKVQNHQFVSLFNSYSCE